MNSTRACGCKSYRTCRVCEAELGLQSIPTWQEELARDAVNTDAVKEGSLALGGGGVCLGSFFRQYETDKLLEDY
jgi:hypothetical protein